MHAHFERIHLETLRTVMAEGISKWTFGSESSVMQALLRDGWVETETRMYNDRGDS